MDPIPLLERTFDPSALALLSGDVAQYYGALPIELQGDARVLVAVSDPSQIEELSTLTNRNVEPVVYPAQEVFDAIAAVYHTKPPEPRSKASEKNPSVEGDPILDRFEEALRRKPSLCPEVYQLADGEADLATVLVDEFLSQGTIAQSRLYWGIDGIFEEREGRLYRTQTPPDHHFSDCLRRLRIVAGLPESSRGPCHSRFELDTGEWKFAVYAAFLDDAALFEFHPTSK